MRRTIEAEKDYSATKTDILRRVGHEDGYGLRSVTYAGTAQDMLDLQIGLIDSLPLARARYVPHRFGIAAAQPEFDVEGATLQVTHVGESAMLRLQGGSPTSDLMVEAMVYDAALPEGAEVRYRWRLDAGPLRISGGGGAYQANVQTRYEERRRCSILLSISSWPAEMRDSAVLRRERVRHLTQLGGLVVKAGLVEWPTMTELPCSARFSWSPTRCVATDATTHLRSGSDADNGHSRRIKPATIRLDPMGSPAGRYVLKAVIPSRDDEGDCINRHPVAAMRD